MLLPYGHRAKGGDICILWRYVEFFLVIHLLEDEKETALLKLYLKKRFQMQMKMKR